MTMNIEQLIERYDQKLQESHKREEILISAFKDVSEKYKSLQTDHVLMYKDATREISSLSGVAQQKIDTLSEIAKEDKIENGKIVATYNYHMQEINNSISANGSLTDIGKNIDSLIRRLDNTDKKFSELAETVKICIQSGVSTPMSNVISHVKSIVLQFKEDMSRRYDNNTTAITLMKEAFDRHATRELIVDMSGIKPKIVYDSATPAETQLNTSTINDMLKKTPNKLVESAYLSSDTIYPDNEEDEEEYTPETRIVEREVESVDYKGRVTTSTITVEEEVPKEEQGEKEEHAVCTPIDDNIRGIMKNTLVHPTLNKFKVNPPAPVRMVPVNMSTYISQTLTPEYISVNFYRKNLSTMNGITNLPDNVKKDAITKMKGWLRNNVGKDPNAYTGSNQTGYNKIIRKTALAHALPNYKLITGEDYVRVTKQK